MILKQPLPVFNFQSGHVLYHLYSVFLPIHNCLMLYLCLFSLLCTNKPFYPLSFYITCYCEYFYHFYIFSSSPIIGYTSIHRFNIIFNNLLTKILCYSSSSSLSLLLLPSCLRFDCILRSNLSSVFWSVLIIQLFCGVQLQSQNWKNSFFFIQPFFISIFQSLFFWKKNVFRHVYITHCVFYMYMLSFMEHFS